MIKKELYFYEEIIFTTISVLSSMFITKFKSDIQLLGIYDKFFIIRKFELTNANSFHDTNKTISDQFCNVVDENFQHDLS